ncbi:hypothetical protein [Candidatus Corynebacterium faecigallinarum]|uniref:hypothetical protein n=1 Tax=Candidatus Corynebacterium faecigallinarum TaxID=2838528 RepID=UPI003FD46B64
MLQPLSRQRVMAALESLGYAYRVDRDRRVSGNWGFATLGVSGATPVSPAPTGMATHTDRT